MLQKAGGKTLYIDHAPFLPIPHPLREPLKHLHNPKGEARNVNRASAISLRTHAELTARLVMPDEEVGPTGPTFAGEL